MTPSLQTLFLPFENGTISFKEPSLFIGARWHPYLNTLKTSLDLWQPFRPFVEELEDHALKPLLDIPSDKSYQRALVLLPKQVDEAKHWLAMALRALNPSGEFVVAGANDAGGTRIEKWLNEAGMNCESLSKHKARVVWGRRPAELPPLVDQWWNGGLPQKIELENDLHCLSQPGLFSWDRIDKGSAFLASFLSPSLQGTGADFGAGTGYLSQKILQTCPNVNRLYVLEADARALACAKTNLESTSKNAEIFFGWNDLSKPVPNLPTLDFIVMNPPFHTGKKTENALGQSFIKTAARHLKKSGTLLMVANTHLPYEELMQQNFKHVQTLSQKDGFKIIEGRT